MAELGEIRIGVITEEGINDPDIIGVVSYHMDDFSRHPEKVRLNFNDGSTAIYDLRVEQPAPVILENIKIIRRMKQGYVNKPLRRRGRK